MTLQEILDELKNIKEQSINQDNITKDSLIEAISDLIHDIEGNDGLDGMSVISDDDYMRYQSMWYRTGLPAEREFYFMTAMNLILIQKPAALNFILIHLNNLVKLVIKTSL